MMQQPTTWSAEDYSALGILPQAAAYVLQACEAVRTLWPRYEDLAFLHQARLLKAFSELGISQRHFYPSTGYGYGDDGRDQLDKLFSRIFQSEDALVRPHWVSGTHVISDSLFALLRPGQTLLSVTGAPYDTLRDVIGAQAPVGGSLTDWGVRYQEIPLTEDGAIQLKQAKAFIMADPSIKLIFIQRSRGYHWRPSLTVRDIGQAIAALKGVRPDVRVLVDNCYGEFTETSEPSSVGADLTVGSLIKNPGGGLAPTGAYGAGTAEAVEALANRLTSPGIGREVGSCPGGYTAYYQGFFMAPHTVSQALMTSVLATYLFSALGFEVLPQWDMPRSDIIVSIRFQTAEALIAFCRGIQRASPVDGHVVPYPWDMPGYSHPVIMAAGTFVQGASIELSADAPIREPYIAYLQGGLTLAHSKAALMHVLTQLVQDGQITL